MTLLALILSLLFGAVVGLVSGLVGVGGGIVMVPFLYFLFGHPEWSGIDIPPAFQAVVAHATSLFVIVPTAVAGILAYHRSKLVAWEVALPMAGTAVLAAMVGVQVAIRLTPEMLKAGFGAFLLASGANLLRATRDKGAGDAPGPKRFTLAVLGGLVVGFITSLLGVGGGIVAIPILIYLLKLDVKRVAATSLGIVVFSALVASGTYWVAGWNHPELPGGSLGYVFAPIGLALLPGAVLTARFGARLNQRMNARALKIVFGLLFLLVGSRIFLGNIAAAFG